MNKIFLLMTLHASQAIQVEKIGIFFERLRYPPLSSRIIALLLVSEPPFQSSEDIKELLHSSKSAVNTSINLLLQEGLIDYFTFPGEKRRYFQVKATSWLKVFEKNMDDLLQFSIVLKEVAHTRSSDYPDFNQKLLNMRAFYQEVEEAMKEVIDRWSDKI
ncbi:GbsR/MarR family transcriptional regulator [Pontibacter harenae]|uniref:GbsR/MarR family transcriptional regulator n=1 Tax=Pontibacter harenae TaxID=2894083 RepID=UPI001E37CBEB|nr:hypothetical protein [Pontibacter harenae]MCC9168710.1 hypothetical protein [Pontibacter harenae]